MTLGCVSTTSRRSWASASLVTRKGRGYASEALVAVSSEAFEQLGMHRLYAGVDPSNEAVIRLLKKAGWRYKGTAVKAYLHRGEWADDSTYALLAEEWHARL